MRLAVAVGSLLIALALVIVLSRSPITVTRVNTVGQSIIGATQQRTEACQSSETLPRGTTGIRLRVLAFSGPRVTVAVRAHGRVIAHGEHGSGWRGGAVTAGVRPLAATRSAVTLCFALLLNGNETVDLVGRAVRGALAAEGLPGRIRVEYIKPAGRSWWSLAPEVARRIGLGRAGAGTWSAILVLGLMGTVVLICCGWPRWSRAGEVRGVPKAALLCGVVACLNATAWSVVTPPFQVPDEPEHVAYVRSLVKLHHLPTTRGPFSREELLALEDLHQLSVAFEPETQTISSRAQEQKLERDLPRGQSSRQDGVGYAGQATSQPPLYYALEAIPYSVGISGTLLDRVELMRLLSALMGGLTALFAFLFVREALPGVRWAWTVGGLGVALVPLLGFMSGAVNPDSMLYAVTAAALYLLSRGFRRGLSRRLAVVLGVAIAVGFATKLNFIGLAPGVLLGLVVLSVRSARSVGRRAYATLAIALAIALSPVALAGLIHLASGAPAFGIVSSAIDTGHGPLLKELSYIWQLYLPRLPGMGDDFAGLSSSKLWFDSYVGQYGWLDTSFPAWVYDLALIPALLIVGLCARGIVIGVGTLRARLAELAVYCSICLGLVVLIGANSYSVFPRVNAEFVQARYLLPLLPLLGAVLALAARGAGRRWGPALGAGIVMLFLAHDIFSQLQTVARFYG